MVDLTRDEFLRQTDGWERIEGEFPVAGYYYRSRSEGGIGAWFHETTQDSYVMFDSLNELLEWEASRD